MSLRDWTFLAAAIGHLALGLVALSRAGRSTLALPVAVLAFDFFGWTFASLLNHRLGGFVFRTIDVVCTALGPPVVLHVVLAFVGALRAHRGVLRWVYAVFGLLALSSASGFFTSAGRAWSESIAWSLVFLSGWLPSFAFEAWLLVAHLRKTAEADEQARTRLVLAALTVGGVFAMSDVLGDFGVSLPALAPLGALLSTLLLATAVLRFRLFEHDLSRSAALYAAVVALTTVALVVSWVTVVRGNAAALALGFGVVALLVAAVVREWTRATSLHRERAARLTVLGRFSAQMAHDLRNPLAALMGAVQVLDAAHPEADNSDRAFRRLIVEQAARIQAIVEKYDRLGRVEARPTLTRVGALVERIVAGARASANEGTNVSSEVGPAVVECELDIDLISQALENLTRNAIEAMPRGGNVVVRARLEPDDGGTLVLAVCDDGEGMDARHAERAFDDFMTTKKDGSGLGLPFVRRVALAHGGDVRLESKRGVGTTVELRLPCPAPPARKALTDSSA